MRKGNGKINTLSHKVLAMYHEKKKGTLIYTVSDFIHTYDLN